MVDTVEPEIEPNAAQASSPILISLLLAGEHVLDAEASMLPRFAERDLSFVQQAHEVLPRDVQDVGCLLCRDDLPDRYDRDRITAGHDLDHALEHVEDRLRDRQPLAARPDELALRCSPLRRVCDPFERTG